MKNCIKYKALCIGEKTRQTSTIWPSLIQDMRVVHFIKIIDDQPFIESIMDHFLEMLVDPNYDILIKYEEVPLNTFFYYQNLRVVTKILSNFNLLLSFSKLYKNKKILFCYFYYIKIYKILQKDHQWEYVNNKLHLY